MLVVARLLADRLSANRLLALRFLAPSGSKKEKPSVTAQLSLLLPAAECRSPTCFRRPNRPNRPVHPAAVHAAAAVLAQQRRPDLPEHRQDAARPQAP